MRRLVLYCLLVSCSTVASAQPLNAAVESAAPVVASPLHRAIEAISDTLAVPAPPSTEKAPVAAPAVALIVRWEVTSPAYYARRLSHPVCPGGSSGPTWAIGYDGGTQTQRAIREDWVAHPARERLATTAGVLGPACRPALPRYLDIYTAYDYAVRVFSERSLIEYERRTARAFRDGYADLHPVARGVLVSLVYNRGASMVGDNRREMKTLRDQCVPAHDYRCITREIRSMKRLWRGTMIEVGMDGRREDEAQLIEQYLGV